MKRKPDNLDLRIAEIEAKKVTEIRQMIVQDCLDHCRKEYPNCPYLEPPRLCRHIRGLLNETIPAVLEDIGKDN